MEYEIKFNVKINQELFEELYNAFNDANKYGNIDKINRLEKIFQTVMAEYWKQVDDNKLNEIKKIKESNIYVPKLILAPDIEEANAVLIKRAYELIESYKN